MYQIQMSLAQTRNDSGYCVQRFSIQVTVETKLILRVSSGLEITGFGSKPRDI